MSDDNVVTLNTEIGEGVALPADRVLEAAVGELDTVIVIGTAKDGSLYVASSEGAADSFATIALAQRWLLAQTAAARGWN